MNTDTTQFDDLRLVARPTAVNCADLFVRFTLTEWALRHMSDETSQIACELVSATVDHADPTAPGLITIRLRLAGTSLVVEVEDYKMPPAMAVAPRFAGLRTGVVPLSNWSSMTWCEIGLPLGATAAGIQLPKRERRRSPEAERLPPEATEIDPQVMQRILYGLNR